MQPKKFESIQDSEKMDIVRDVKDAYEKSLKPPNDDRRLRFVVSIDKVLNFHDYITLIAFSDPWHQGLIDPYK